MVKRVSQWFLILIVALSQPLFAQPSEILTPPRLTNATEPQPGLAPALWRIADEDTTIWLFGTIHLLPEGFAWRNGFIDAAIESADTLVLETVTTDSSEGTLLLMELGIAEDLPPITERIEQARQSALDAMIARGPFPETFLSMLETWAATLMLVGVALNDLGLDPDSGVEGQLEAVFRANGRPIIGLETAADQLGYFDSLPEPAQRHFLGTIVDTPEDIRAQFQAMLDAWVTGNEEAIAATFDDDLSLSPALRDALLTRRNAKWADWIVQRMAEPGTVFMAVGAGHLTGSETVQNFAVERGLSVERMQ